MKIAFLGDSITYGYALDDLSKRYTSLICEKTGDTEINFGITGTLMARTGMNLSDGKSFIDRVGLIMPYDFAVIFGGTNDYFWSDVPIYPPKSEKSFRYFADATEEICRRCAAERDKNKTLIVTPYRHNGVGNFKGGKDYCDSSRHDTDCENFCGHTLEDYVRVILSSAEKYGLPSLNLYDGFPFDYRIHTVDGCHPNEKGHELLAEAIGEKIKSANI